MRRLFPVAIVLTAIFFAACQPSSELTDVQKGEVIAEVNMTLDAFWDTWARVDFEQGMEYWLDSSELLFAGPDGRITKGYTTLESLYRPFFGTLSHQNFTFDETYVKALTIDAAYAMQRGTYSQTDTSGVTGPTLPFAYTYVWERTETGWKISSAQMSAGDPIEQ